MIQADGIVLKSIDYKDRHKIITVFTGDFGILSMMVKRVKNNVNLTSPLSRIEFSASSGRGDLYHFKEGRTIDLFPELRERFSSIKSAGRILKLLLLSQFPEKPAPQLYALLLSYLKKLPANPTTIFYSFLLKLLSYEGGLHLTPNCAACAKPLQTLSLCDGEGFCSSCAPHTSLLFMPSEWTELKALVSTRHFSTLSSLSLSEPLQAKLDAVENLL